MLCFSEGNHRNTGGSFPKLGYPSIDPNILYSPYSWRPRKGTPNFGKPPGMFGREWAAASKDGRLALGNFADRWDLGVSQNSGYPFWGSLY